MDVQDAKILMASGVIRPILDLPDDEYWQLIADLEADTKKQVTQN